MGYAEEPLPDPQHFLKKNVTDSKGATAALPAPCKSLSLFGKASVVFVLRLAKGRDVTQRKPPVPSIRDAPKMGARTEKNFIQTNALDVVMTVPKKPERNVVDDRFGDKFPIDTSGLTPKYVMKKVSGQSGYSRSSSSSL